MKKSFSIFLLSGALIIYSCGNNADNSANNDSAGTSNTTEGNTTNAANNTTQAPLSEADRQFVMDAAAANTMEIQAANIAMQNGVSQRVKDYAAMMIRDHGTAGNELKTYASSRNAMVTDSLPTEMRNHMEEMKKMKGKAFDNHYMKMMTDDHQKTITKFENASNTAADADLKAWATKTLPVLRAHLDSAKAIRAKM
jgi:putative membrane protein